MNNFASIFDELTKLYEEAPKVVNKKVDDLCAVMLDDQQKYTGTREECENWLKDKTGPLASRFKIVQGADVPVIEALTEAAEDEEIEIVDDEAAVEEIPAEEPVAEEEPKQTIIECSKCGALVIVDEVVVDEETDLVNVEDECKFCEEKEGYKIVGSVVPYEAAAEAEPVEDEAAEVEEPVEDEANEDDFLDEDLADIYRKVFDRPASFDTQQAWEDELNGFMGEISDKRRAHLERKFKQQRDWEARHPDKVEPLPKLTPFNQKDEEVPADEDAE
jgi:hypothetical protein